MCVSLISFREIHESDFHLQGPPAKHDEIWQNNASNHRMHRALEKWEYVSASSSSMVLSASLNSSCTIHWSTRIHKIRNSEFGYHFGEGVHLLAGLHHFPSNATPEHLKRQTYRLFRSLCLLCLCWGFFGIGTWNGHTHFLTLLWLLCPCWGRRPYHGRRLPGQLWPGQAWCKVCQPIDYVFASNKSRVHRSISASCYEQTTKIWVYKCKYICYILYISNILTYTNVTWSRQCGPFFLTVGSTLLWYSG